MKNKKAWTLVLAASAGASLVAGGANRASADVVASWNFNAYATATVIANPAASSVAPGVTASSSSLGMTNNYTYANGEGPGAVDGSNIVAPGGGASDNGWRIVGNSNATNSGAGKANGWNTAAPQYTQGAEFAFTGGSYASESLSFAWFTTTQGVANLQVLESSDGGGTWTNVGNVLQMVATGDVNTNYETFTQALDPGTNAVALVSAYNPTLGNTYASATSVGAGAPVAYNNSSGNWRFTDVAVTGTVVATPEPASLGLLGVASLALLFRRRRA